MSLAPAGPHPNPLPKGEGDLYSFGVVGYHDPARGDSRIAPVRDSRGCGGSRPSLFSERNMVPDQSLVPAGAGTPRYENWRRRLVGSFERHSCRLSAPWIPAPYRRSAHAFAGKTKWGRRVDIGGGIAICVLSRDVSAWIPAFAGMTNVGVRWRTQQPLKRIFVPMTN